MLPVTFSNDCSLSGRALQNSLVFKLTFFYLVNLQGSEAGTHIADPHDAAHKMTRCAWANRFVASTGQLGGQPEILGPSGFNLNSQNFEPMYDNHHVKSSRVSIARHSF